MGVLGRLGGVSGVLGWVSSGGWVGVPEGLERRGWSGAVGWRVGWRARAIERVEVGVLTSAELIGSVAQGWSWR